MKMLVGFIAVLGLLLSSVAVAADPGKEAIEKGKALHEKKDYDGAIAAFTEAVKLDPKNAEAYYNRGDTYEDAGEHDKAVVDFTDAIRLNRKYADAYCGRAQPVLLVVP